jgi:uncharacterized repeat protein (TIGR03803 family)
LFKLDPVTGTLTTLHTFAGAAGMDGNNPQAALIYVDGVLYGTTASGGAFNAGTVFKFDIASGKETVVHNFSGGMDGTTPMAAFIQVGGVLYSTTSGGGPAVCGATGCGTVFKINMKSGAKQMVYGFHGGSDGQIPLAGVKYLNGVLYGTTTAGGSAYGTVFTIKTSTKLHTVLHAFAGGNDGQAPATDLLMTGGMFYGTTQLGGSSPCQIPTPPNQPTEYQPCGSLFSVDPSAQSFSNLGSLQSTDGGSPGPLSVHHGASKSVHHGVAYASAVIAGSADAGTVFETDLTTGTASPVYSFTGGTDGAYPAGGLLSMGSELYGVTTGGGLGFGTVYKLTP